MADLRHCVGSLLVCGFAGTDLPSDFRTQLKDNCLGGIILFARNYTSRAALAQLTQQIQQLSPTPVLIAVDQEGGRVVRFSGDFPVYPSPQYFGRRHDIDGLLFAAGETAKQLKQAGVNLNLVPVCDLSPDNSAHVIYSRSYSADPEEVSEIVRGQTHSMHREGVLSCAKHFPGLASAFGDPHVTVSQSNQSLNDFRSRDYIPFRAAISEVVDTVMVTHLRAPKIDPDNIATFSRIFIEQELREHLGFAGLVISDDLLMAGSLEGITASQAGIKAVTAGCDLLIYGDLSDNITETIDLITRAAETDSALGDKIVDSSTRIAQLKQDKMTKGAEPPEST